MLIHKQTFVPGWARRLELAAKVAPNDISDVDGDCRVVSNQSEPTAHNYVFENQTLDEKLCWI